MLMQSIKSAFKASSPALIGYIAIGTAFGFLFQKAGAAWYLAPMMSLFVYAGAAQFIAMSIMAAHGTIWQIAGATFFVNLRHIFYGVSFVGKFNNKFYTKAYMIFGLTDEAYSILSTNKVTGDKNYNFLVILFAHLYWVVGTLIGSIIGSKITVDFSFLQFSLTALFIVLAIEQAYAVRKWLPFLVAIVSSAIALIWIHEEMIVIAILMSALALMVHYKISSVES